MSTNNVQFDNACIGGILPGSPTDQRILPSGLAPGWAFSCAEETMDKKLWTVNDLIRVRADSGGFRVWRVTGIFLGALHQEDVIELETLDRDKNTEGRMCVPRELLDAALTTSCNRAFSCAEVGE